MTPANALFVVIASVSLFLLPRRSAVLPLLIAAAYTTRSPVLDIGPASFSVFRFLVVIGLVRVSVRGEGIASGLNTIDRLLIAWSALLLGVSIFHTSDSWVFRGGMILGEVGFYFLCRAFVRDLEDVRHVFKALCVLLMPLAILMLLEKYLAQNLFVVMGQIDAINIREGHVRSHGPFAHAILAGTVGATVLPMAVALWGNHRARALLGLAAGAGIIYASASSGPVMMAVFTCAGLLIWKVRRKLRWIRWCALAVIMGLQLVMHDPVYFLMARIDIAGGSTGWHRAQLIRSSIEHLDEWWAVGTDYTRHWMPTGIHANEIHTDITNHFLLMGVLGGVPLMLLFAGALFVAFHKIGTALRDTEMIAPEDRFLVWTLGAVLFGHATNFFGIALFDQSVTFFYLILASIGAACLDSSGEGTRAPRCREGAEDPVSAGHISRRSERRWPVGRIINAGPLVTNERISALSNHEGGRHGAAAPED